MLEEVFVTTSFKLFSCHSSDSTLNTMMTLQKVNKTKRLEMSK